MKQFFNFENQQQMFLVHESFRSWLLSLSSSSPELEMMFLLFLHFFFATLLNIRPQRKKARERESQIPMRDFHSNGESRRQLPLNMTDFFFSLLLTHARTSPLFLSLSHKRNERGKVCVNISWRQPSPLKLFTLTLLYSPLSLTLSHTRNVTYSFALTKKHSLSVSPYTLSLPLSLPPSFSLFPLPTQQLSPSSFCLK